MGHAMIRLLLVNCWSLSVLLALPCLYLVACFHSPTKVQLRGRWRKFLHFGWQCLRHPQTRGGWVFFCSSAGEYEQAVPLLARLKGRREAKIVIFFSHSGYRFAALRQEQAYCLLAPPDLLWSWWLFFCACRPRAVIVVRHELWPAFLYAARCWSKLYLVNASFPHLRYRGLKGWLLAFFSKILVVDELDRITAQHSLYVPRTRLVVTGDSKYDRAAQRVAECALHDAAFSLLQRHAPRQQLLIGSAWEEEVSAVLNAYRPHRHRWQVLIAPHEPHAQMVAWIETRCFQQKFSVRRYTQLSLLFADADVVIIDTLGRLTELYALAELALVGGGLRGKVHNVLEPVFHGLPTAMGKNFTDSSEAKLLFDAGWITAVDADSLAGWWQTQTPKSEDRERCERQLAFVHKLCGATETICAVLEADCAD